MTNAPQIGNLTSLVSKVEETLALLPVDHSPIVETTKKIAAALEAGATTADILPLYDEYETRLVDHFVAEEKFFAALPHTEEAKAHIRRHAKKHNDMRDLLAYTRMKLSEAKHEAVPPNIVPLLPVKYMEEMLDQDMEMAELLKSK